MKILIISQYFFPEEFKINDLARELVQRGHAVTVLTGKPNYPKGVYYDGYQYSGVVTEDYYGAEVIRVPLRKRGSGGGANLLRNYMSFVVNANRYIRKHTMTFDAILCFEISPITQAYPALLCKKKYGGKVLLWVQDLWPESVTAAGGVTNRFALSILEKMVKRIYSKCDILLTQSEGFKESILSKGDFASKMVYAPNWAEDLYLSGERINDSAVARLMPEGFRVMFAGNVGAAQDMESIILATQETRGIPEIKWVIVGDGRERASAEQKVQELDLSDTVVFLGRHPMNEMPTFFSYADVMLVSLRDEYIFSLTVPAKTQSYMASGKPIASMLNGEGNRIVQEADCGLTAASGDYKALAKNVIAFYQMSKDERDKMGRRGRDYYLAHFDKKTVVDTIIASMK